MVASFIAALVGMVLAALLYIHRVSETTTVTSVARRGAAVIGADLGESSS